MNLFIASGVIAYNGDSERGWNDPPTLSFNTVTSSKKGPKLDLRKRVSHHEALTGRKVSSPLTQNPPNLYQQGNNVTDGTRLLVLFIDDNTLDIAQENLNSFCVCVFHSYRLQIRRPHDLLCLVKPRLFG